jgi:micrococcal nuclease
MERLRFPRTELTPFSIGITTCVTARIASIVRSTCGSWHGIFRQVKRGKASKSWSQGCTTEKYHPVADQAVSGERLKFIWLTAAYERMMAPVWSSALWNPLRHLPALIAISLSLPAHAVQVIGIADGDTLTVLEDRKPVQIRLANIDAPERQQAFGNRAQESLAELCLDRDAKYDLHSTDRYGGIVATLYCDDINVNRAQVERGMAWVNPQYSKDYLIPALQDQAFSARRGLWADPQAVPPWEWRKAKHDK